MKTSCSAGRIKEAILTALMESTGIIILSYLYSFFYNNRISYLQLVPLSSIGPVRFIKCKFEGI
jgi:hypothetical protein